MLIHAVYGIAKNSNTSPSRGLSAVQIQGMTAVHENIHLTGKSVKLPEGKMRYIQWVPRSWDVWYHNSAASLQNTQYIYIYINCKNISAYSVTSGVSDLLILNHTGLKKGKQAETYAHECAPWHNGYRCTQQLSAT